MPRIGSLIDGYEIQNEIAHGGMGVIYSAQKLLFSVRQFKEKGLLFITKLKNSTDSLSIFIKDNFSSEMQDKLKKNQQIEEEFLVNEINRIIITRLNIESYKQEWSNQIRELLQQNHTDNDVTRKIRIILEEDYKDEIIKEDEKVAIKFIRSCTDDSSKRFKREAEALLQISHANIVKLISYGYDELCKEYYMILEYLKGKSLREYIKIEKQLTWQTALPIWIQITQGIIAAHEKNLIHRDLKPDNIMILDDQSIKIIDFGLVRDPENLTQTIITQEGHYVGTPAWSSPEQLNSQPVTKKFDLYSMGCIFYYMLKGESLYAESNKHILTIAFDKFKKNENIKLLCPLLKESICDIIHKLLEIPPHSYRDASELLQDLNNITIEPLQAIPKLKIIDRGNYQEKTRSGEFVDFIEDTSFYIAQFPILRRDYQIFIESQGYDKEEYWKIGWTIKTNEHWTSPEGWERPAKDDLLPVTGVSWYEANAFCQWLGSHFREVVCTLPTKGQWIRAARGNKNIPYPWGDHPISYRSLFFGKKSFRINCKEYWEYQKKEAKITPVSYFTKGNSTSGCSDMLGNIWEWLMPGNSINEDQPRWVIGGSYNESKNNISIDKIERKAAQTRNLDIGFRIILYPASKLALELEKYNVAPGL